MLRSLRSKVVAIPMANTVTGASVAKLLAVEDGKLALGAPTGAHLKTVESGLLGHHHLYSQQVDLDRPKSVDQFFKIAFGQFGRLDAIVLEAIHTSPRRTGTEQIIAMGARRMLHCLDAAFQYAEDDLHVISIAPEAGRTAIPVATAFVGARFATTKSSSVPRLRISIVSPVEGQNLLDGSLARTVLHVMREERCPSVTETVLVRPNSHREAPARLLGARSKFGAAM